MHNLPPEEWAVKNRLRLVLVIFIALLLITMQSSGGEQSDWAIGERCAIETTDFIPHHRDFRDGIHYG